MNKTRIVALAAVLTASVSAPALADWDRIGSIKVDYQQDRDTASPNFGGPVERLQFTARGSDIQCRYIRATFGNGSTQEVFSGRLAQGSGRSVDLPGDRRNISRITTMCHAFQRAGATIDISADIGQYRDTWRRSPDWNRMWAGMFRWTNNTGNNWDKNTSYSVPLGSVRFTRRDQSDGATPGWTGRSLQSIALKAQDGDAYCTRVTARFGNGQRTDLALRQPFLRRGQAITLQLPGRGDRNITALNLRCKTLNTRSVSISISGNK